MENRKGAPAEKARHPAQGPTILHFLFSIFYFFTGCGAPGDPRPPSPPVPAAIVDLSARQDGDGVQLSFTLPSKSISGERLASSPAVEILRGALKPDGSLESKSFRVVDTIPGALIDNYRSDDHFQFTDPIAPGETKAHPGAAVSYLVRTRASQKRTSGDSNVVSVRVFSVPERIASVEARLTSPPSNSAGQPRRAPPRVNRFPRSRDTGSTARRLIHPPPPRPRKFLRKVKGKRHLHRSPHRKPTVTSILRLISTGRIFTRSAASSKLKAKNWSPLIRRG